MGKVAILGLGDSLNLFDAKEYDFSIGVNDIWSRHPAEYVVCVDHRDRFTEERLKSIDGCKPLKFYSHIDEYFARPDFFKIELIDWTLSIENCSFM